MNIFEKYNDFEILRKGLKIGTYLLHYNSSSLSIFIYKILNTIDYGYETEYVCQVDSDNIITTNKIWRPFAEYNFSIFLDSATTKVLPEEYNRHIDKFLIFN